MDRVTRGRRAGPLFLVMTLLGGAPAVAQADLSGVRDIRSHEDQFEQHTSAWEPEPCSSR